MWVCCESGIGEVMHQCGNDRVGEVGGLRVGIRGGGGGVLWYCLLSAFEGLPGLIHGWRSGEGGCWMMGCGVRDEICRFGRAEGWGGG